MIVSIQTQTQTQTQPSQAKLVFFWAGIGLDWAERLACEGSKRKKHKIQGLECNKTNKDKNPNLSAHLFSRVSLLLTEQSSSSHPRRGGAEASILLHHGSHAQSRVRSFLTGFSANSSMNFCLLLFLKKTVIGIIFWIFFFFYNEDKGICVVLADMSLISVILFQ